MLLAAHLEEVVLKGTRHASLLADCFGGKFVQQARWEAGGGAREGERSRTGRARERDATKQAGGRAAVEKAARET